MSIVTVIVTVRSVGHVACYMRKDDENVVEDPTVSKVTVTEATKEYPAMM